MGFAQKSKLLAILLRVGVTGTNVVQLAQQLLVERGGWPGLLRADYADLCRKHGIGEAKAATLKAALEIGRRLLLTEHEQRFQIKSPADAAGLLMLTSSMTSGLFTSCRTAAFMVCSSGSLLLARD